MSEREAVVRPPWVRWEWAALAATVTALVLYAAFPVWRAPALAPAGAEFGGVAVGVRDANFYLSLIRQDPGALPLLRNPFGEPGADRIFWGAYWWLLAHLRHLTGLSPATVFHLARYDAAVGCVCALAWLATLATRTRGERWLAIQLGTWGGGFGWVVGVAGWRGVQSADLLTPETSTYYTVLSFPHLGAALALMIGCVAALWMAVEEDTAKPWGWVAGGLAVLLGAFHPFNVLVLLTAWSLQGFVLHWRDRARYATWLRCGWPLLAGSALTILYFGLVLAAYPAGLPQTVVRHLPYADLALGFGLLGLGGALYALWLTRRNAWDAGTAWCGMWIVATLVLLNSYPLLKQEGRAILGVHVPLALWSALFLSRATARWSDPARGAAGILLVACALPTAGWVQHERVQRLEAVPSRYYVPQGEVAAAAQLAERVTAEDRVACTASSGSMLASRIPARLFLGRWDEPTASAHEAVMIELLDPRTPAGTRRALVERHGITVLWISELERRAYANPLADAAARQLATEVLVSDGGVLAVRVAPSPDR